MASNAPLANTTNNSVRIPHNVYVRIRHCFLNRQKARRNHFKQNGNTIVKITLSSRLDRGGCYFASAYVVLVVVVFTATAATTDRSKVGLDWIPFTILALPWFALDARLLVPGLIANTVLMYFLGAALHRVWQGIGEWG